MKRLLLVLMLGCSATAGSACMDMQTASLGNELPRGRATVPDAGSAAASARDAAAARPEVDDAPPPVDASQREDDAGPADVAESVDEAADAGALDAGARPGGAVLDMTSDAAPANPPPDASAPDAGRARADDERDASRDAAKPVNPICITEPWHCP